MSNLEYTKNMSFQTREEVAKYFRVHVRTIDRWIRSGILKGYKLGKGKTALWRISEDAIDKFLKKHEYPKKKWPKE